MPSKPGVVGSIPGFSSLLDETLNRGPITIFYDKLLTSAPNFLSVVFVSFSPLIWAISISVQKKHQIHIICLMLFTCNYVVSVWRGFLFLWVLGMGYVILLWHSLSLPYNYFIINGVIIAFMNISDIFWNIFIISATNNNKAK